MKELSTSSSENGLKCAYTSNEYTWKKHVFIHFCFCVVTNMINCTLNIKSVQMYCPNNVCSIFWVWTYLIFETAERGNKILLLSVYSSNSLSEYLIHIVKITLLIIILICIESTKHFKSANKVRRSFIQDQDHQRIHAYKTKYK